MLGIFLFCLVGVVWAAASPATPLWAPWIVPGAIGAVYFVQWRHEATWTGGGDAQPGLVAVVGFIAVAVLVAGILIGYGIRAWRTRERPGS